MPAVAAAPKPTVTALSPASGLPAGGTTVTLTGTRFSGATSVKFGSSLATGVTVVSDTTITATAPAHRVGTASVQVTTPDGSSSNSSKSKYLYQDLPAITKLSKNSGGTSGGLVITIRGKNLKGLSQASFGGVPGTITPTNSGSAVRVTVPPHQPGTVELIVRTPSGSSSPAAFTYFGAGLAPSTWRTVIAGDEHSCGIRTDDSLWCWGDNDHGQLGLGDTTKRTAPTRVGSSSWRSVSAGRRHTCGIRTDDTLACWGDNDHGQLGLGDTTEQRTPTRVGDEDWGSVAAGSDHTCGIRANQTLWCWGDNENGQLGLGDTTDQQTVPTPVGADTWTTISAGLAHTCGIRTDDTLACWGDNAHGQLGLGDTTDQQTVPTPVGDDTWTSISAGLAHTCGIRTDNTLACWGDNQDGQLGAGDRDDRTDPTTVGAKMWRSIAAADRHTCGTQADRTLWCWGDNSRGQLGIGHSADKLAPTAVGPQTPPMQPMSLPAETTEHVEDWADLNEVKATGVQVSGNRLYSTGASGNHGYTRALDFPHQGVWSFQQVVYLEGGSTSPAPTIKIGISCGDPTKGFSDNDADALGWQIKFSSRARSTFKGANLSQLPIMNQLVAGPSIEKATGRYLFSIDADEHFISFSLKRADFAAELATFKIRRSDLVKAGKTITKAYASIADSRGAHGSALSPFIFRTGSLQPSATSTVAGQTIEGAAQHVINTGANDASPMSWYVALPPGDPTNAPLVIDVPQALTGDGDDAWTEPRMSSIIDALTKAGFLFASSTDTRDRFGNQVELDNYKDLHDYVMEHFGAERDVFLFGTSMGSIASISLVARGMIDANAVATIGFAGGFDNLWDALAGTKRADIRAAYGFTGNPSLEQRRAYTAGYDPLLSFIGDPDFAGKAFRFYTGTADTTTPKALSDTMAAIVRTAGASAASVVVGDGGHLSSAQFQGDDLVAFYQRNLTVLPANSATSRWSTVAVGGDGHTCGITVDNSLWCWGDNSRSQLGFDSFGAKYTPARLSN